METNSAEAVTSATLPSQDQKFCMDCGKIILRRAEICPGCGCRQVSQASVRNSPPAEQPASLRSDFVGKMAALLLLNFLWNGLGNLAIGDKRGWQYGFFNWVVIAAAVFTLWIPALLFFAYCGYAGYQFLLGQESER